MKASILITSYNYDRFVGETIRSALGQTWPGVEVVVVDDGSRDRSVDVIRSFGPRVKSLFKSNGGQASAINAGFALCTGDVIFLLDSDDVLKPTAVEQVVSRWRPEYSKMHFRLGVTDSALQRLGASIPRGRLAEGNVLPELLESGLYLSPPTSGNVFARTLLEKILPMPEHEWRFGAETYPVFLAPLFGQIGAIHEELGLYRTHSGNFTGLGRRIEPQKLLNLLQIDMTMRRTLERFSQELHLPLSPAASNSHWLHYKIRLACCKLARGGHPFPSDGVLELAKRLIRSAARAPELSPALRAAFTAWAVAVALLPPFASEPLIRMAFSPGDRPPLVRAFLGKE